MLFQILSGSVAIIILYILLFVFFLIFITLFLKIGLSFVDADKREFGQAFLTAFLCTLVMWALIVLVRIFISSSFIWLIIAILIGLIICWAIIAKRHDIGFGSAIFVTIIAVIAAVIIIIILILVIGFLLGVALWVF
jgi:hypothetical protein